MPFNLSNRRRGFQVGIELEFEDPSAHSDLYREEGTPCFDSWTLKEDGSLRFGAELVSIPLPYPSEVFNFAMEELTDINMRYPTAQIGRRTSMHVHVNVSDLTDEQFKSFMYLAVCLEPVLIRYCADYRHESNFCAPVYNSLNQSHYLRDMFFEEDNTRLHSRLHDMPKYAAIGLYRLRDLGTVEFRMFEGSMSRDRIERTVQLLHSIYTQAVRSSVEELADSKRQQGVLTLLTPMLRDIYGQFINQNEIENTIERGVKMANDMVRPLISTEELMKIHADMFPRSEEPVVERFSPPLLDGMTMNQSAVWHYANNPDTYQPYDILYLAKDIGDATLVENFNSYVGYCIRNGAENGQPLYEEVFDKLYQLAKYFEANCNRLLENGTGTTEQDRTATYRYGG